MNKVCLKCKAELASPWNFCPKCGAAIASEIPVKVILPEVEKAPVFGAFSGLYFGIIAVPMLFIVGGLLCLTGLGAFVGVPMIILAVFAPLLGPMIGLGTVKGKCPWCGAFVDSVTDASSFDCLECDKRITVENHKFIRAE